MSQLEFLQGLRVEVAVGVALVGAAEGNSFTEQEQDESRALSGVVGLSLGLLSLSRLSRATLELSK